MGRKIASMPLRARKLVLVVHIITSVGWLGLSIGYLALGITAWSTDRPEIQHAMFWALGVFGDILLIPISLLALLSGLLLGAGTQWGLLRHRWVVVKLVLTLVAVILIPVSLLQGIHQSVDAVEHSAPGQFADIGSSNTSGLLFAGGVSSSMYITCVLLSVLKPWGRTAYGKRKQAMASAAKAG